ncbi:MAG: hypothetical protein ACLQVN_24935 [Bryobacteraceae bacterium]
MGRPVIIEKLNRELSEPITSERQVVYILVETRKLVELLGLKHEYRQLIFFCDWAMHPILDRRTARMIIEPFDTTVAATMSLPPRPDDLAANPNAMQDYIANIAASFDMAGFETFKEELERFYRSQQINCDLVQNQKEWLRFLGYYSGVIEDCPLECRDNSMAHVKALLLRKVPAGSYSDDSRIMLRLQWIWVHEDGSQTSIVNTTLGYPPGPEKDVA